jgi:hypothetical protein
MVVRSMKAKDVAATADNHFYFSFISLKLRHLSYCW